MSSSSQFAKPVPVTVVTGEYKSGKTVFALTTGYPLERTLIYDNELSSETYHTPENPFVRVDLPGEMSRTHPKGYTELQLFEAFLKHMRAIQPGQYDVMIIDTVEAIEDGLTDWVNANPGHFGHSAAQYQKMAGIMWGDVKSEWKRIIQEMKARCQMVILIVHMRDEYKNNVRTGKRERRGKETLSELATLEVELSRSKPGQTIPSARVHKDRFFAGSLALGGGAIKPTLPTWLEVCTWDVIKGYLITPVEHDILPPPEDEDKKRREEEMERLKLQALIAESEAAKAQANAATAQVMATRAAAQQPTHANSTAPSLTPKALLWRKLRERIGELGGDVTNPKAALEKINAPWASEMLKLIETENWDKALQLDMSANPPEVS